MRTQRDSLALDLRAPVEYAASHIPRSYSFPFGGSSGTWVGWLVEENRPLVLVSDDESSRENIVCQLVRIGYDVFDGYLEGGMAAWQDARLPVVQLATITVEDLYARLEGGTAITPLDVRFPYEWAQGHVPGAVQVSFGDLPEESGSLSTDAQYAAMCAAGVRASTGASVLEREGLDNVSLVLGGTNDWTEAGFPLEKPAPR